MFLECLRDRNVRRFFDRDNVIDETATPSGIESLSYNFSLPVLATNVGHFPETIKDGFNGYLAEPENVQSMADVMLKFLEHPVPRQNVAESTKLMSWENYGRAIMTK